jgi:hypothetical protein
VIAANPLTVSREVSPLARFGPVIEYASASRPLYFRTGDREIVGIG